MTGITIISSSHIPVMPVSTQNMVQTSIIWKIDFSVSKIIVILSDFSIFWKILCKLSIWKISLQE